LENRDYADQIVLRCSTKAVLQKRNTEFFSLEYCPAMAIIRGAMASNKIADSATQKIPAQRLLISTTWGCNESQL
jgi:hypothetical protein